jgi:hypothetical protein
VHGDHHPGNVRGRTLLDWGDSVVGHPAYDAWGMVGDLEARPAAPILDAWCALWRAARPAATRARRVAPRHRVCQVSWNGSSTPNTLTTPGTG